MFRFTTEIVLKLGNSVIQIVGFLLEGVPINSSAGESVGRKSDSLMYSSLIWISVVLKSTAPTV